MYLLTGQNDLAIQDFTAAIELDPSFADAILNRGLTLASASRCAEAIPDFTRVIALSPQDPKAYVERAVCHEAAGDDSRALDDLSAHLKLDPATRVAVRPSGPRSNTWALEWSMVEPS